MNDMRDNWIDFKEEKPKKKGYVKLEDLEQTLKDEANIVFDMEV